MRNHRPQARELAARPWAPSSGKRVQVRSTALGISTAGSDAREGLALSGLPHFRKTTGSGVPPGLGARAEFGLRRFNLVDAGLLPLGFGNPSPDATALGIGGGDG